MRSISQLCQRCLWVEAMMDSLKRHFVDMRVISFVMCMWLGIVILILVELGIFTSSKFVSFGPRTDLSFMHVSIDTYEKYNMLISMIITHTFVTDLIADSLSPHVLNVVQVSSTYPLQICADCCAGLH